MCLALPDDVADDDRDAAVGELELVGGAALRPVVEQVVADVACARAGFHEVPLVALVEAASRQLETRDASDVQQVLERAPIARCTAELAVLDLELRGGVAAGQDPILVVREPAPAHREPPLLEADPRTVQVGSACAAELDPFDDVVAVTKHPDRLAFRDGPLRIEHRRSADAADDEPLLRPHGDVAAIGAGGDLDRVAVAGRLRGVRDPRKREPGPDGERGGNRGMAGAERREPRGRAHADASAPLRPAKLRSPQSAGGASARSGNSTSV